MALTVGDTAHTLNVETEKKLLRVVIVCSDWRDVCKEKLVHEVVKLAAIWITTMSAISGNHTDFQDVQDTEFLSMQTHDRTALSTHISSISF
ncbi:hypothetical protein PsorP6_014261 [Peronosclerospora sorghi]|uniref:Uncharacterized protein n=1 Tax=Peronosclerospora sorghi TaxID=230839 RepID=A0ACC0VG31_9STRA|nr:hypothetical protein PsorP6_014261 [Peronosclerospora sorghi]